MAETLRAKRQAVCVRLFACLFVFPRACLCVICQGLLCICVWRLIISMNEFQSQFVDVH